MSLVLRINILTKQNMQGQFIVESNKCLRSKEYYGRYDLLVMKSKETKTW
jgi:hypothetical protein